jgi:hypothetical protein
MRIEKLEEKLLSLDFPAIGKFDFSHIQAGDTILVCAGFEDRALYVIESINQKDIPCNVVLIGYMPQVDENRKKTIESLCQNKCINLSEVTYDRQLPDGAGEKAIASIKNTNKNTFVDISGMSRLLIVQLIYAYKKEFGTFDNFNILYTEAKTYPPFEKDFELSKDQEKLESTMFLTSGIFEIIIMPEFSSTALFDQPIRLVVFPSFNPFQLISLLNEIQPSFITVINGLPPHDDLLWRKEAIRKINGVDNLQNKEEIDVSTFDYRESMKSLLEIYKKSSEMERIFISPTGSKLQSISIGILKSFFNDVNIIYPLPNAFIDPKEYTLGVKECYHLDLSSIA